MNNIKSKDAVALNVCSNKKMLYDFLFEIANKRKPADFVFEVMIGKRIDCSFMFYNKVTLENPFVEYRVYNNNYIFSFVTGRSMVTIPVITNVSLKMLDDKTQAQVPEKIAYIDLTTNYFGNDVDLKIKVKKKIE